MNYCNRYSIHITLNLLYNPRRSARNQYVFEKYCINDVDSFRDAKHHHVKFLLIRFSCSDLVETKNQHFHDSENFKNLDFRADGAPSARKYKFFQHRKNYFLLKIIFPSLFFALKVLRM